jgi:glyoxylate reductase
MQNKKAVVVVTRRLPDPIETRMMELFDARLNLDDHAMSPEELREAVTYADVLVPTVTDRIDHSVIAAAGPQLRLIASFGNGTDHLDIGAARERNITVTNTPGVLTEDTADFAMTLILAVARRLSEGERLLRSGKWTGWKPTNLLGHRIRGKRLGIVGMGRIGQALATRARSFGLAIHYHNRRRLPAPIETPLEATYWQSLDQMLARMDIVSVNCPYTPQTHLLLSAPRLKLLQPHAFLVNTSRGDVIDEAALIRMLQNNEIAGAGLDVYSNEPNINPKFYKLHNAVLAPHMGSATIESRIDMGEKVLINIKTFVDGHKPPDRVIDTRL